MSQENVDAVRKAVKGANVIVRQPLGILAWDFSDGKIGKARFYHSWDEALEAVGPR